MTSDKSGDSLWTSQIDTYYLYLILISVGVPSEIYIKNTFNNITLHKHKVLKVKGHVFIY